MSEDLTTHPIKKLVRTLAIPASIGFFFNTMYNVVDTYFAGLLSTQAIAALSLSFPVFFTIIAMGSGISNGATALIANALGAKNNSDARTFAAQSISFGVLFSIFLTFLGLFTAPALFKILGATEAYLVDALAYINVIFYGVVFFILNYVLNAILVAKGDTKSFRNALIAGFVLNLILDPWFLYGGFGLPALGIAGIAWATVVIQALSCVYMGYKVLGTGLITKECLKQFMPRKEPYLEISKQGFPSSLTMMTVAIGIFVITYFVSRFGQDAVAAFGIATRIEQMALVPTIGLNMAALTLVGQNNGARKFARVKEAIKHCIVDGCLLATAGSILLLIFAEPLMGFFTDAESVISIGTTYLRIAAFISWAYILIFVTSSALQGLKKPMFTVWVGLYRQIVGPLIIFALLTSIFGLLGVWIGVFVITWSAALLTLWYLRHLLKKLYGKA